MKRTTSMASPSYVDPFQQPPTTSPPEDLDHSKDDLIHEARQIGQGPSPSLPLGIPQPATPQKELGAPTPSDMTAPRVELPVESCHPPGDEITLDSTLSISDQVDLLILLALRFTLHQQESIDHDPRADEFPFKEAVLRAQQYAADNQATGLIAAVSLLSSYLNEIALPVYPHQWPTIRAGLDLLQKHVFRALLAGWTPPYGWEDRGNCLGQIQLHRTLFNPHLSPQQCLEELARSEHAVRLLKRELLQKPSPWTPALRQLSWMLWPLAPTLSGDMVSNPSLNDQLKDRLLQEGQDDMTDADRMALGVQGLFELCPGTYETHATDDHGNPDRVITCPPHSNGH